MDKFKIQTFSSESLCDYEVLKTSSPKINEILKGGFRSNILNELVGIGGSGKTQLCLHLSLMVQLPRELGGLSKAAVYVCTEDVFPIKRLHELSYYFNQKFGIKNSMDNVFISHISDLKKLETLLASDIKYLAKFKDIGLIIIDSIAGLFRSDNLEINYANRSKDLAKIVSELRKLGMKWHCVIICCNQMSDNITNGCQEPCLGLTWSNLINNRFLLTRMNSSLRKFQVIFSPNLSCSTSEFSITSGGIK